MTEVEMKEASEAGQTAALGGMPTYPYFDPTSERKLQIFHAILQQRHDLSPLDAAKAAESVFQLLCIPQPPSASAV